MSTRQRDQKLEAIAGFAGGLAHDLNNLLTIVLGNLQLVKRRLGDAPGLANRLEAALGAGSRAAELTRRLLGISHLQPMRVEAVDVGALVTGLADQLRRTWGDSIAVESSVEPDVGSLQTDPGQLEAALVDLCLNAREAMAAGGRLRLVVRRVPRGEGRPDSIAALPSGDYAAVEVRDDGAGMTPDVLERAFDPFFTTKELGHGAGLGLSVVHGFVRRAHGAVDLESEPGKGTCATLYLPRTVEARRDADTRPEARGAKSMRRATVLVVEDDEDIREFAASVLRDAGYEVCEAADGRSAVEILRHRPPFDLLLTDVMLPGGMTGQEVAGEAQAGERPVPVLYASGHAPDALLRDGRLRGYESFLAKPYSADDLVRSVHDACGPPGSSAIRCTRR
jgi:CheY-like chemotaxis protein